MQAIRLNYDHMKNYISMAELEQAQEKITAAHRQLRERNGPGNQFLGWLDLPFQKLDEIPFFEGTAEAVRKSADVFICVGIGGSYLGAKSIIDALSPHFKAEHSHNPEVVFAGHHIDGAYLNELIRYVQDKNCWLNVISKSGTTTEPGIAFRVLKKMMEEKYGAAGARKRIIAVTDKSKGSLRQLAEQEKYVTFVIPDDIGGRFSVLTPVGLLPIAAAGFDVTELLRGARDMAEQLVSPDIFRNVANLYAGLRYLLYSKGKVIEILSGFNPKLIYFAEWWKQLFGESEGKDHKGIFPASANFTTDLHSLGQYIQDGLRIMFETFLITSSETSDISVSADDANLDGLNYLAGRTFHDINYMAYQGTALAHVDGGAPNMTLEIPALDEYWLGQLIFFFETAVAVSGYLLGVNPFDQPGVEAYKRNMFRLLDKPGV
ncbi:MAG: glucose-6-phosphate isomerase [Candidatus Zhuqueibacterota bacterium]